MIKNIANDLNKKMAKIECQQILLRYRFQGTPATHQNDRLPVHATQTRRSEMRSQDSANPFSESPFQSSSGSYRAVLENERSPTYPQEFINIGEMQMQ